jgi:hypothetical protein
MPFRITEDSSKIQFITSAAMPKRVYDACVATGTLLNTRYVQEAVCDALSRDLGIPLEDLLAELPPCRTRNMVLFDPDHKGKDGKFIKKARIGMRNTVEEVK